MHNLSLTILLTLILALVLMLMPMPGWTVWLRPAWVLMVLMYWAIVAPQQVGLGVAWMMGIVVDLLNGSLLGEHALAYTVIIYFVARMHIRLRMHPLLQQGMSVCFFTLFYQFILYCIQGFIGQLPASHLYWLASFTTMLLWPWLFILLRDSQRWFKTA